MDMFSKQILANPDLSIRYCHCPTITFTAGGDFLVAWYAYPDEETRHAVLMIAHKAVRKTSFEPPGRSFPS